MKKNVRCLVCNNAMSISRENRRFGDGLDVVLIGIEVRRCSECGEEEAVIPRIAEVRSTIAENLIQRSTRLTPAEIRFLRTYLGYSGGDFAEKIGVTREAVSRWENGARPMGKTAERLLRLMVAFHIGAGPYDLADKGVDGEHQRLTLRQSSGSWSVAPAPGY